MALGGGQQIGASCYYLNIGGTKLLLDCGKGMDNRHHAYGPDFSLLTKYGEMSSPGKLDGIIISHAHFDHIGSLLDFTARYSSIPVYATSTTKQLGKHIMDASRQRVRAWDKANLFYKMNELTLNKKTGIAEGRVDITLYQAGHVPGACMVYIQSSCGNILYTGDFSPRRMALAGKYALPDDLHPDAVILCGVHAKHPEYSLTNDMDRFFRKLSFVLQSGTNVYLRIGQLTKGIELIHKIDDAMKRKILPEMPVFYDENIEILAHELDRVRIQSLTARSHSYEKSKGKSGIFIGCEELPPHWIRDYQKFETKFSLHADYEDIKDLLKRLAAKKVIVVHTSDDREIKNEYALERDFEETTVYYPKNGELIEL